MNDNDIRPARQTARSADALSFEIERLVEAAEGQGRPMLAYLLRIALSEARDDEDEGERSGRLGPDGSRHPGRSSSVRGNRDATKPL